MSVLSLQPTAKPLSTANKIERGVFPTPPLELYIVNRIPHPFSIISNFGITEKTSITDNIENIKYHYANQ
jgi:hypothetical protein